MLGRVYQVHCIDVKDIKGTTKNREECNKTCEKRSIRLDARWIRELVYNFEG